MHVPRLRNHLPAPSRELSHLLHQTGSLRIHFIEKPRRILWKQPLQPKPCRSVKIQKNAIYLIELLLSRLSKLIEQPLEHVEQFEGPISSTWESLKMLYNRIEHDA